MSYTKGTMVFLFAALVLLIMSAVAFYIACRLHDNSIVDVFYGLLFLCVALSLPFVVDVIHPVVYIITFLISVWSLRLSIRIARKNLGKNEDFRYAAWRSQWMEKGALYFYVRSYFQVFVLQSAIVFFVLFPLLLVYAHGIYDHVATLVLWTGVLLWIVGFSFEVVADHQLDHFLHTKKRKTEILTSGLFSFCRRPNYFGESLMWWGIATLAASVLPVTYIPLAYISPILITYIVYAVTGPMLEKRWEKSRAYQQYVRRTNYFLPGLSQKKLAKTKNVE